MAEEASSTKSQSNTKWIVFIILALILGGLGGYAFGKNKTETDVKKQYDQQVQKLEDDLSTAKKSASGTVKEGQAAVTEGQQTIDTLKAENAQLKTTIDEQTKKIADLEKQLEEAKKAQTTPPAN